MIGASALAGVAVFAYFRVVEAALDPVAADRLVVFYTLSLLIGFGAFQPLESELARTLAHRRDTTAALREAAVVAAAVAAVVVALVAAAVVPLRELFTGSGLLVAATAGVAVVSALQFWVRGALLGGGRPTAFAATIAVDSVLRVAVAGALALAVVRPSAALFSLSLLLPLLLAHLVCVPAARRAGRPPPDSTGAATGGWGRPGALARRIAPLFLAAVCAQLLLAAPVLLVQALAAPGQVAAFVFAFTLARVPLFMAVPVQGALVPPMAAMVAAGRLDALVRLLLAVAALVAVIAAVGGGIAAWLGSDVLTALFPRTAAVPDGDLALMVVGVAAHVGLLVSAQANVAAGHHLGSGLSYAAGLAVAAAVFALGGGLSPLPRVEWAFAAGSAAGWVLAMVLLLRHARADRHGRPSAQDQESARTEEADGDR